MRAIQQHGILVAYKLAIFARAFIFLAVGEDHVHVLVKALQYAVELLDFTHNYPDSTANALVNNLEGKDVSNSEYFLISHGLNCNLMVKLELQHSDVLLLILDYLREHNLVGSMLLLEQEANTTLYRYS